MLNVFLRATRQVCRWPLNQSSATAAAVQQQRIQAYASFTVRDIFNESSDESGTLLHHFAKHIALECGKHTPSVPTEIRYSDFFPVTDLRYFQRELRKTAAEQLPALIIFTSTYRSNADPVKLAQVLNDLDAAAVQQLPDMDDHTILRTLYALLFFIPNWITRCDFYRSAVRRLVERGDFAAETGLMQKFVQLCFYLGLDKKRAQAEGNAPLLARLLHDHLERFLPELSSMDLAVISSAAYKTSTPVQIAAYSQRLEQEVLKLPLDGSQDALLMNFLKAMRFERVRSEQCCKNLTANLVQQRDSLERQQTRGLVHLFAFFAENLWDSSESTGPLIAEFMQRMGSTTGNRFQASAGDSTDLLRPKDIATFLWSCAQLNCSIAAADLQRIEMLIMDKLRCNEFRYFSDQLVDCCLQLWSLGHHSRELLQTVITMKAEPSRQQQREKPKVDSRLTVLLTAAAIEQPTWMLKSGKAKSPPAFDSSVSAPAYLLKNRGDLTAYAKRLSTEQHVAEASLICPCNGINIPSLLVRFNTPDESVFVELLTPEQMLRFSEQPVAVPRLKIRLLTALGHKVVVLRPRDLFEENYSSLADIVFNNEEKASAQTVEKPDGDEADVQSEEKESAARSV